MAIVVAETLITGKVNLGKERILRAIGSHIDAVSIDALIEPETHTLVEILSHTGILPIQVGLLAAEIMEIIGIGQRIVTPGTEVGIHVAMTMGRNALFSRPPMIIVAIGIVAAFS